MIQKHGHASSGNGFAFVPFTFDTFSGLSLEAASQLLRLQWSLSGTLKLGIVLLYHIFGVELVFSFFRGISQQLLERQTLKPIKTSALKTLRR